MKSAEAASSPIRVAVVDMQPITPAVGGGRLRLLGLYHALGTGFETTYVGTYDWPGERARERQLSGSLLEIDIPLSSEHFREDGRWRDYAGGATIIDSAFSILGRLSGEFLQRARATVVAADIVVFSHPWLHPLLAADIDATRQLVVYDAQNVEALLRLDILGSTAFGREIATGVAMAEAFLCRAADLVIGCSADDVSFFANAYGIAADRLSIVPNGVFVDAIVPGKSREASTMPRAAGAAASPLAIFIGSHYGPNVGAAEFIVRTLAPALPNVTFEICGGVADAPSVRRDCPVNVRLVGKLSDEDKLRHLQCADIAVNPMFAGSGTNIKMFDFMAAGLSVVATSLGARGICDETRYGVIVCDADRMIGALARLVADGATCRRLGESNREWVMRDFSWEKLSPALGVKLRESLAARVSVRAAAARAANAPPVDIGRTGEAQANGATPPETARIAILSTFGIRCGIAEYTSYLAESLLDAGTELTIVANRMDGHDATGVCVPQRLRGASVERIWHYDNVRWTDGRVEPRDVIRLLRKRRVNHLNVQYHRGFFAESVLIDLLKRVLADGIPVSVSLHNSTDSTPHLLAALAAMPITVVVHRRAERDRLRALGIHGATYIPQGIPTPPAIDEALPRALAVGGGPPPVIGTFGFLRPHKGLLELIDAVSILRSVFPGLRLLAQTALYPSPDSAAYLQKVTQRIEALALADAITLDHGFRDIDEVITRLVAVDVVVLPYARSDEGSSAAAAAALAARRALITTSAPIFDELGGVAYRAEDNSPPVLAAAIGTVLSNDALRGHLARRSGRYADSRGWGAVARQLLGLIATQRRERTDVVDGSGCAHMNTAARA
jgi:glycosyltransferase involved in cell wall biosynthesis